MATKRTTTVEEATFQLAVDTAVAARLAQIETEQIAEMTTWVVKMLRHVETKCEIKGTKVEHCTWYGITTDQMITPTAVLPDGSLGMSTDRVSVENLFRKAFVPVFGEDIRDLTTLLERAVKRGLILARNKQGTREDGTKFAMGRQYWTAENARSMVKTGKNGARTNYSF